MTNLEKLCPNIKGIKKKSDTQYQALCPAHDDKHPSLSITISNKGNPIFKCHAGCDFKDIIKASGYECKDSKPAKQTILDVYEYFNEDEEYLFEAVRFAPKNFRYRRKDPNNPSEWIYNINGVSRVLYNLPNILKAITNNEPILIVEGEKDVDNAKRKLQIQATTNPLGAGKWKIEYSQYLKNANIIIIPDNDEAGKKHALEIANSVCGIAKSTKLLTLPELAPKEDLSDWITRGKTKKDLLDLIVSTPEYSNTGTANENNEVEKYLRSKYIFRFNVVTNKVEFSLKSTNSFADVNDYV
ncbi:MAG: hypothetical protein WD578_09345, partial [Bacteroidales bacterium]